MPKDRHYGVRPACGAGRERRLQNCMRLLLAGVFLTAAIAVPLAERDADAVDIGIEDRQAEMLAITDTADDWEDPLEAEKIEQALVEQGYFRYDVPLDFMEQDFLHTACEEAGVPYALALAVIERETGFRNVLGDDGESAGYMQVQKKWHMDRMEKLGVTDLSDSFSNFRVACDYLAELMGKYPLEEALTAYNTGSPGRNDYSRAVIENYEKWKELVGDEISGCKS